jgi:hypothetical protein
MSDYKAKNYIDNGILELILDLCSPEQWHPEKLKKENIPLLTPVENVYPPMINPPYSFEDIISGSKDKPKIIYFPSNSDGTPKRWDGEQDTRFKAIDDFNAYAKHYDERVEDIWKKDGVNDLNSKVQHPLFKRAHPPLSPYTLIYIIFKHHYGQRDEFNHDNFDSRYVENECLWRIYMTDREDVDFVRMINKTIFDYMKLVTKGRELIEGDLYYNPMREFVRYAEKEGFDYDDIPNALDINTDAPKIAKVEVGTSPLDKVVSGDSVPNDFKITINKDHKKIRFSRGTGRHTDWLSKKELSKLGFPPKFLDLIIRYGHFQKALATDKDADWMWMDIVKDVREYKTIQKYQSDLAKWCQTNLNMIESPFIKSGEVQGEQMMEGAFKTDTYRCHFDIRFEADWTETKGYKRIKGSVVDVDKKNR